MSEQDQAAEAQAAQAARAKAAKARIEAAKAKAAKARAAKAEAAKATEKTRVKTLGVTSPAVSSVSKTKTPAPSVVVASVGDSSRTTQMILLALFGVSALLILAALVPLNYEFVPYRLVIAWHDRRAGMAVLGGSLLVLAAVFYALLHV